MTEKKPLFALNATTGQQLWSVVATADSPSPLAVSQGVVVLFSGNAFCGYHSSDGSPAWCTNVPSVRIAGDAVFAQQDRVYGIYASSFSTLSLNVFNSKNGQRLWSIAISGNLMNTTQISSAGNVLLSYGDTLLQAFDPVTGQVLWQDGEAPYSVAAGN